ncbi:amino acid adenylation domain-containing protein [Pseudomonas sp. CAU 1711]|uniref:non-ribosomal peptide synthetase n=1 Tax=Pseudomonas sp. CAU 1711 TaxID=3140356 RepID=UPI0032605608
MNDDALLALLLDEAQASADAILSRPGAEPAPLSFAQQRLWLLHKLDPAGASYNLTRAFLLDGLLDVAALERAFGALIERHEILRTQFVEYDGEPLQVVCSGNGFAIPLEDCSGVSAEKRLGLLRERLELESLRAFDLQRAPLLRIVLLRFGEQHHGLLLAMHHIVSDAWSNPILVRDLAALYRAELDGQAVDLPPLPVQYADYAVWQRQRLNGEALRADLAYWRDYLGERIPVLELPTDHLRPPRQGHRGRRLRFELPLELADSVRSFCRAEGCTPFVVLLAAWQVLLARYSGQREFAIGVPHAARGQYELEELIGFFVNTLVYRVELGEAVSGRALCRRLRGESLAALDHAELPFEMLLEQSQVEFDASRSPLFQVMFNLSSGAPVCLSLAKVRAEQVRTDADSAKFDLSLDVALRPDGVFCELEYSLELFLPATAERLAAHYRQLLAALIGQPDVPVWRLPLLADDERERSLRQWNRTARPLNEGEDMLALFERQVRVAPQRIALICGNERLSYGDLNARANRLANWLRQAGVARDRLVAVCLEREAALLVALLAIHKAGAAYLPMDPAQPAVRNADILGQAQPCLVLTRQVMAGAFAEYPPVVTLEALGSELASYGVDDLGLAVHPQQLAYSLYTSGSTGRPKGVQIGRQAFVNFLHGIQDYARITADDRLLAVTTLGFDIAGLELFLPLLHGACVVLATREQVLQPVELLRLLERQAITVMQATPASWEMLVEHASPAWNGLRVLCGGEALGADLARRLLVRGVTLTNLYGPTETTVWSAAEPVREVAGATVPLGRPLANNHLYILDEYLQPQPPGVTGELYIGGAGLARGYAQRPELTAAAFVPNPFCASDAPGAGPGSRLYRTGDLARQYPDGRIEFIGRRDFQVKLRGFRIELGEIEAALASHPRIQQAVVVVRRAPGGQEALVAYLRGDSPSSDALVAHLRERLPGYMVPAVFVTLDGFPLNANGKVDRKGLPEPRWQGPEEGPPPRSEWELRLATIWHEVLGVPVQSVNDDLFALGAQSVQLVRMQSRLRSAYGHEPTLAELFAHPRLGDMAALLERSAHAEPNDKLALIDSLLEAFE